MIDSRIRGQRKIVHQIRRIRPLFQVFPILRRNDKCSYKPVEAGTYFRITTPYRGELNHPFSCREPFPVIEILRIGL